MVCVHCGSETEVINSRGQKRLNQVWRRRKCLRCGSIFSTHEAADYSTVWLVKDAQGALRPFAREKLFLSLYKSLQHRPSALADAAALTDTVIAKLLPVIQESTVASSTVSRIVSVALNRFDKAASVHYQAFHGNHS